MRLTLRTLLAYLDGILEPNDAQDVGKKIEESEFATGLVHRIRDVMRRLRLGAPSLTDRSPKLDPNNVAEYLDNTLASEGVTDFEKVCLESDVHLAEVASSHQILTLVLGEPAEIDPASRQRMYQLKDAPAGAAPPPTPTVGATAAVPSASTPPSLDLDRGDGESAERKFRPRPTVPEYLREPRKRRRWLPEAATVVLVACFAVVVLMAFGQFEPGTPLGNALVRWGVLIPPQDLAAGPGEAREERGEGRGERDEGRGERGEGRGESKDVAQPPPAVQNRPGQPGAAVPQVGIGIGAKLPPTKEPANEPATEPSKKAANTPIKESAPPPVKPPTTDLVIKSETPVKVKPDAEPDAESDAAAPDKSGTEPTTKPAVEPLPLPPEPLGRLVSSDQVLLKDDPAGGWVRVAANQLLMPQRLLALPTYRAKVNLLTVGVTLKILGGTQIELLPGSPQDLPGIRVLYGRVVMMPLGNAGSQLRVALGSRSGVVTFPDAESVAALEVRRIHVPGTDPEVGPPHVVANLYAATGGVVWDETGGGQGGKTTQLAAPQWVGFNADLTLAPAASKELPKWIESDIMGRLERGASAAIAQALPTDSPARLRLLELTSRPQKEVRWLALRCLGYIGQYRDMVTVLNDTAHKLDWSDYIDQLCEAVARDSESAAAVRLALEKQYPQQAADLYRMLWSYSDKDLETGEDIKLVRALRDETLAVRVLSFWNLKDLTGLGGQIYQPEQTAAKRQQPTRRWEQRLEAKEIRLKTSEEKAGAATEENATPPAAESGR